MTKKNIILASQSPRRREILNSLRVPFIVIYPDVEELHPPDSGPDEIVMLNAEKKAQDLLKRCKNTYIIGSDTIVYFNGEILTKPADFNQAKEFLLKLSGRTHTVYSGVAVYDSDSKRVEQDFCTTDVTFRKLDEHQIERYIHLVHPYDKAGAYAIQGCGALIVERIDGCFYNVMGLPVITLDTVFLRFGYSLFDYVMP
ncbi:MAG: Maf family protein [Candidatus Auribacterota bacterium]